MISQEQLDEFLKSKKSKEPNLRLYVKYSTTDIGRYPRLTRLIYIWRTHMRGVHFGGRHPHYPSSSHLLRTKIGRWELTSSGVGPLSEYRPQLEGGRNQFGDTYQEIMLSL